MKKTYKEPSIKVKMIKHTGIICTSPTPTVNTNNSSDKMESKSSFLNFIGGVDGEDE